MQVHHCSEWASHFGASSWKWLHQSNGMRKACYFVINTYVYTRGYDITGTADKPACILWVFLEYSKVGADHSVWVYNSLEASADVNQVSQRRSLKTWLNLSRIVDFDKAGKGYKVLLRTFDIHQSTVKPTAGNTLYEVYLPLNSCLLACVIVVHWLI